MEAVVTFVYTCTFTFTADFIVHLAVRAGVDLTVQELLDFRQGLRPRGAPHLLQKSLHRHPHNVIKGGVS